MVLNRDERLELRQLIPHLREKMFCGAVESTKWGIQYWKPGRADVDFYNEKRELTDDDLFEHFTESLQCFDYPTGALGVILNFKGVSKAFCVDIDQPEAVGIMREKFLPVLDERGIDYVWEYGGPKLNKAHLWWFFDQAIPIPGMKAFIETLYKLAGIPDWHGTHKLENFPTHKDSNLIRLFLGHHLRAKRVCPIEDRDGRLIEKTLPALKYILGLKPYKYEDMLKLVLEHQSPLESGNDPDHVLGFDETIVPKKKKRTYVRQYLPHSYAGVGAPRIFETTLSECQVANFLQQKTDKEKYLDKTGDDVHKYGLYVSGMLAYEAEKAKTADDYERVRKFRDDYFTENRNRPADDHHWDREDDLPAYRKFPSCAAWDKTFRKCNGCPLRGNINSPKDIAFMKPVQMIQGEEVKTDTAENIRAEVNAYTRKKLQDSLREGKPFDNPLFIDSVQGTYKSTDVANEAVWMAKNGYKSLIIEPTAELAMDQYRRCRAQGVVPFVAFSHKNLFKYLNELGKKTFPCPHDEDIQQAQAAGAGRETVKQNFCANCPFEFECPFPEQYTNLQSTYKRIVIVQHAHLGTGPVMKTIMKKGFDAVFIDETFIDSLTQYIKVKETEIKIFESLVDHYPWLEIILEWFKGAMPTEKIYPKLDEMVDVVKKLTYHEQPNNLRLYIEHCNAKRIYNVQDGLFRFRPLPMHDRMIFTDATLPKDLVRVILNTLRIESIGSDKLINIKLYNPANEAIKVIDGSTSSTSMKDPNKLGKWLRVIGVAASGKWKDLTHLVTVYKRDIEKAEHYFRTYFPDAADRITVASMAIGSNEWKDTNVQWQLCGVHYSEETMQHWEWVIRNIRNYHLQKDGREPNRNVKPADDYSFPFPTKWVPLELNLMSRNGKTYKTVFPDYLTPVPKIWEWEIANELALGITQQGKRLRTHDENIKILVDCSNRPQKGIAYTKIKLESELFAEAGVKEDELIID